MSLLCQLHGVVRLTSFKETLEVVLRDKTLHAKGGILGFGPWY